MTLAAPGFLVLVSAQLATPPAAVPAPTHTVSPEAARRMSAAVMPLEAGNQMVPAVVKLLGDSLVEAVRDAQVFRSVVSFSEIQTLVGFEQQRQLLDCSQDSCMAELAGSLGVDFLFTGNVGRLGDVYLINLRLLDVRRASAVATVSVRVRHGSDVALLDAVIASARELMVRAGLLAPGAAAGRATPAPSSGSGGGGPGRGVLWPAGATAVVLGVLGAVPVLALALLAATAVTVPYLVHVPSPGVGGAARRAVFPGVAALAGVVALVGGLAGVGLVSTGGALFVAGMVRG